MTQWIARFVRRGLTIGIGVLVPGAGVAAYGMYLRAGMAGLERLATPGAADWQFLAVLVPAALLCAFILLALYELAKWAEDARKVWWHGRPHV